MLSPVVGALILQVSDWRMTFWCSGRRGLVLLCARRAVRGDAAAGRAVPRYRCSAASGSWAPWPRTRASLRSCAIVGLYNLPFMAYIAVGSYVYISFFGLSELEYSVFFAVAALLTAAGLFIWLKASRYASARRFTGDPAGRRLRSRVWRCCRW
ncbi:MAG: hypothetical protein V8S24_16755 [Gordonibacter pamelaeae]